MTPKEKAKELVLKYWNLPIKMNHIIDGVIHVETDKHLYVNDAKKCALIAVDEILNDKEECGFDCGGYPYLFWEQVKQEINKL